MASRNPFSLSASLAVVRRWRAGLVLCVLLLAMQGGAPWHDLDLAEHAQSEPCGVCVALSGSAAGALPAAAAAAFVPPLPQAVAATVADAPDLFPTAYRAIRAPPRSRPT